MSSQPGFEKPAPTKAGPVLSPKAAEYKGRIEEAISERGLSSRAKVQGAGSTLTLAGKLRPAEHRALLKFLRDAPSDVRIIDHIEYDETPDRAAANPTPATPTRDPPTPSLTLITTPT